MDSLQPGAQPGFCNYEGSDYRTAFWQSQNRDYEDLAERIALTRLLPPRGERIIDIGGGFGRLVDLYHGYTQVILLDYSRSLLEEARQRLGNDGRIKFVAASLYSMPFADGTFPTTVMVRVLHHQTDPLAALRAVRRVTQPGGTFVLEYANKRNIKAILRYALGRQAASPFSREAWEFAPLNFNFHPDQVESDLKQAGFLIEDTLAVSHLRLALLKRIIPAHTLAAMDGWLQRPTAALKLSPSVFVRSKARTQDEAPNTPASLFCCPLCHGPLTTESESLRCPSCERRWSTAGGIHDFRAPLDA